MRLHAYGVWVIRELNALYNSIGCPGGCHYVLAQSVDSLVVVGIGTDIFRANDFSQLRAWFDGERMGKIYQCFKLGGAIVVEAWVGGFEMLVQRATKVNVEQLHAAANAQDWFT